MRHWVQTGEDPEDHPLYTKTVTAIWQPAFALFILSSASPFPPTFETSLLSPQPPAPQFVPVIVHADVHAQLPTTAVVTSLASLAFAMGLLEEVTASASHHFAQLSTASQVGVLFLAFVTLSVVINVAQQLLFKNPNEPPVVFHLFPIIGSTVTYGMDPPRFFVENRNKVSPPPSAPFFLPPPLQKAGTD